MKKNIIAEWSAPEVQKSLFNINGIIYEAVVYEEYVIPGYKIIKGFYPWGKPGSFVKVE